MSVTILFIGDLVGKPGRQAVSRELDRLVDRYAVDLVIANGENSAGGFGLTVEVAKELFSMGIDCLTSGNHIWDKKEQVAQILADPRIIRPANYPDGVPGCGSTIVTTPGGVKIAVLNLEGRVYMKKSGMWGHARLNNWMTIDHAAPNLRREHPVSFSGCLRTPPPKEEEQ